jgi:hypothetical protein
MKLYHGTSARHLDSILAHGLCPRNDAPGHWEQYPSRPDMVYVTSAYPFFFATHTDDEDGHGNYQPEKLVVEIDSTKLDQRLLYPDEDFVAQIVARQTNNHIAAIHDDIRANLTDMTCQDPAGNAVPAWEASLVALATCCYRGVIPRHAMTRYCVFDWRHRTLLGAMAYNEGPYLGGPHEQYRQLTLWMFGNRRKLPRFVPANFIGAIHGTDCPRVTARLRYPNYKREEVDRTGVTVVNL